MPKIGWNLIGFIWCYNLVWLIALDLLKVGLFKMFDMQSERGNSWQHWVHKRLDPFHGLHHK